MLSLSFRDATVSQHSLIKTCKRPTVVYVGAPALERGNNCWLAGTRDTLTGWGLGQSADDAGFHYFT